VVAQLAKAGHEITITATGSEPSLPVAKTLYMSLEGIDWLFVRGQDAVIHLMANNDTRCQDWNEIWRANVYGSVRLFREAYQFGCRRFVYASSAAVYGNSPAPFTEKTPIDPLTYYAKSKEALDHLAWVFATEDHSDVSMSVLRFCNIYGPGEDHKGSRISMVGQLIRKVVQSTNRVVQGW
jgi:ADP-L-glycero-D-manno-heptose 6-epimerase